MYLIVGATGGRPRRQPNSAAPITLGTACRLPACSTPPPAVERPQAPTPG